MRSDVRFLAVTSPEGATTPAAQWKPLASARLEEDKIYMQWADGAASLSGYAYVRVDASWGASGHSIAFAVDQDGKVSDSLLRKWAEVLLKPQILRGVFQPQAWQNDYAVDVDGALEFDVAPILALQDLDDMRSLVERAHRDLDWMSEYIPVVHDGPFSVQAGDVQDWLELISMMADLEFELESFDDITEPIWSDFQAEISKVLQYRQEAWPSRGQKLQVSVQQLECVIAAVQDLRNSASDDGCSDGLMVVDGQYLAQLEQALAPIRAHIQREELDAALPDPAPGPG